MAMNFKVEKKGERFLVFNESTGYVRGRFKTEGEAKIYRNRLQDEHNSAIEASSARISPPRTDDEVQEEGDGE